MPHKTQQARAAYQSGWWKRNRKKHIGYVSRYKAEKRLWLADIRSKLACEVCGEDHPACLDFHHRNPSSKSMEIGAMVNRGCSKEKILAEIAKCAVLCSNCHRKLHYYNEKGLVPKNLLPTLAVSDTVCDAGKWTSATLAS